MTSSPCLTPASFIQRSSPPYPKSGTPYCKHSPYFALTQHILNPTSAQPLPNVYPSVTQRPSSPYPTASQLIPKRAHLFPNSVTASGQPEGVLTAQDSQRFIEPGTGYQGDLSPIPKVYLTLSKARPCLRNLSHRQGPHRRCRRDGKRRGDRIRLQ